jgi:rSAM/selenodomain-associated transferase 1
MTISPGVARRAGLATSGAVLTIVAVWWAARGDQTHRVPEFLAGFGLAAVAYGVALTCARGVSSRWMTALLGGAVLWRVLLIATPPMLSDDIYRYVWEGRIQLHGGNPFAWADRPEAEHWSGLRDDIWQGVNHKGYTAIYPAFWQLAAAAVVAFDDSLTGMKAFVVACELLMWLALAGLLRRRGLPRERLLIAAWSPLALVEIAGSGHNDALGMALAVGALLAIESGHPWRSAIAVALGAQAKVLPGLLAATWGRRYRLRHVLVAIGVAGLLAVPYLSAGRGLIHSATKYSRFWLFNETLFALLTTVLKHTDAVRLGAAVTILIALACGLKRVDPAHGALAVVSAWLLLAPNVLPWYALWLLPWLVLSPVPAALLFTVTVPLAYLVYPTWLVGGRWEVSWGVRALEYGPCALVAAVGVWSALRRPRTRNASPGESEGGVARMKGRDVLLVFLKAPEMGEVKTRLGAAIGPNHAATLYRRMAEQIVTATTPSSDAYLQVLVFAPAGAREGIEAWLPGRAVWPQPDGDLGARMAGASAAALAAGAHRVVIVGTDVPSLDRVVIHDALRALDDHEVVLGPAEDGGYWLIGLRQPQPELFDGVPWSTEQVAATTQARAEAAGLRLALLAPRQDIDTIDDLRASWEDLEPLLRGDPESLHAIREQLGQGE